MVKNPGQMLKKAITETIVEELFRELGFYVLRFGQENTFTPIVQLEDFIKNCGGSFKIEKCVPEYITPIDFVKTLPDFLIVHNDGRIRFLEVKYRYNGDLWPKDTDIFDTFDTIMVVVNSTVDDKILNHDFIYIEDDHNLIEELKKTRFHVYSEREDEEYEKLNLTVLPLKRFLKEKFEIDNDYAIDYFESLIPQWIPTRDK